MRALVLVVLGALGALGCNPTEPSSTVNPNPQPNIVICVNGSCNSGGASPSPSPGAGGPCTPIVSTGISFLGDPARSTIGVGQDAPLDTTPKNAQGERVNAGCPGTADVFWDAGPLSVCRLSGTTSGPEGYTPRLHGLSQGTCNVFVRVGPVTSNRAIPVV